jgi:hypothetical protein
MTRKSKIGTSPCPKGLEVWIWHENSMDIVYHAILTVFGGKAFFAPLENPQRIVDMGTGTGAWLLVPISSVR